MERQHQHAMTGYQVVDERRPPDLARRPRQDASRDERRKPNLPCNLAPQTQRRLMLSLKISVFNFLIQNEPFQI